MRYDTATIIAMKYCMQEMNETENREYIDIGANLSASCFNRDIDAVIERALNASVKQMIVTGTNIKHSQQAIELSERYPNVCYATAGLHPHHASDYSADIFSELKELCAHESVLAVGECGLDYNRNFSSRKEQIRAFEAQLELAAECRKPVFLHQRDAHADFLNILDEYRPALSNAVAHCFTGNLDEVRDYLALDMYIGLTGWISDERRGQDLQNAVHDIPLNRIMLETDAPYLLPRNLKLKPVKKGRNEPCFLPEIATKVAHYMQVDEKLLWQYALANTQSFFFDID